MRHAQIVVFETDGFLAAQVGDLAQENGWLVREARHADACVSLLSANSPAVLLLKLGRKMIDELSLLARLHEQAPDCPVIVVSDGKLDGADQRMNLAGLAHDLGARYIMFPPLTRPTIEDVVAGLLEATIQRYA